MIPSLRLLLVGLRSYLPTRDHYSMAESPVDVEYAYSVWLRHVSALARHGLSGPYKTVAELGPGNSAALAACAILSGSHSYLGLDVLPHLSRSQLESSLRKVADLLHQQTAIPTEGRFASLCPPVVDTAFPAEALEQFRGSESASKVPAGYQRDIANLASGGTGGDTVRWLCPWTSAALSPGSVDLVISQAVLQEIPHANKGGALREAFSVTADFLRRGGVASHQIDLGFYGEGPWNVHWTWSDLSWKLVRGKRENFVNREPLGTYVSLAEEAGFDVVTVDTVQLHGVRDEELASRFIRLPENERRARSAHLILRKR